MIELAVVICNNKLLKLIIVIFSFGCLSSCGYNSDFKIEGTKWKVTSLKLTKYSAAENSKGEQIIEFLNSKNYVLNLDVNYCTGNFKSLTNNRIIFESVSCTELCCDSIFSENLVNLLILTTRFTFDGGVLTLKGKGEIKLEKHL